MANNNQIANTNGGSNLKGLLKSPAIQNQLNNLLKDRSSQFASSLITLASNDPQLNDAEPMSIISGAIQAAQLSLPLEKQFGFVYLIPFNTKNRQTNQWEKKAQFVLGYKGYIQLAQRSGQYSRINVGNVHEGQLKSWDPFKEELEFDPNAKASDEVIGYFGFFRLLNGFEKTVYWTREQIEDHRIQNNKGKNKKQLSGVWASNYDAMAQKTVIRSMLSRWGILSTEMQQAILADEEPEYEDTETQVMRDVSENANQELIDFDNQAPVKAENFNVEPQNSDNSNHARELTTEEIEELRNGKPESNGNDEQGALFKNMTDLDPGY